MSSVTGWAKAAWGYYEKYLFPWDGKEDTMAITILVMVKNNQAYIGDGWARLGNSLKEEKAYIATKSPTDSYLGRCPVCDFQ